MRDERGSCLGFKSIALLRETVDLLTQDGIRASAASPKSVVSHMFISTGGSYSAIQPAKEPGSTLRSSSRRVLRTCRSESKEPTRRASSSQFSTVVERITRLMSGI